MKVWELCEIHQHQIVMSETELVRCVVCLKTWESRRHHDAEVECAVAMVNTRFPEGAEI